VKVTPTPRLVPVTITSHEACGMWYVAREQILMQTVLFSGFQLQFALAHHIVLSLDCGCQLVEEFKTGSIDKLKSKRTLHPPPTSQYPLL